MDKSNIEQFLNEKLNSTQGSQEQNYYDHFKSGSEYYRKNQPEDALEHFTISLDIARKLRSKSLAFFGYYGLGYSYALSNQYGQTIRCFEECLDIAKRLKTNGEVELCVAYIALGDGHVLTGRSKKALEFYKDGLEKAAQMHDGQRESIGYLKLADVYIITSQYTEALEHYKTCFKKAEEKGDMFTTLQARQGMGDSYKLTGQFSKALEHYEECLKISVALNDKYQQSLVYLALGDLFRHTGPCVRAFEYYQKSLALALEFSNKSSEIRAYLGIGYIYFLNGKFFKAEKNFEKCSNIAVEIRDRRLVAASNVGLGDVCRLTGDYSRAIEYYDKSLEIAAATELCDIETAAHLGLGDLFAVTGKCSKGLEHFNKCFHQSIKVGDLYHKCQAYLGMGDVDVVEGRYEAAIKKYENGLAIAAEITERNCESRARRSLGDALMLNSSNTEATREYQRALRIAEEVGNTYEKSLSHLGLGRVNNSIGNLDKASDHFRKGFSFAGEMSASNLENPTGNMGSGIGSNKNTNSDHYKKGLPFAHPIGKFGVLAGYWECGDLYCKLGKYDEALQLFERYLEIVEETKDLIEQERVCKRLANIYDHRGRYYMMRQFQEKQRVIAKELEKVHSGSPESWKWEESSIVHREKFVKLLKHGQEKPEEIKEINGVRVCCSTDFLIGMGGEGTRVYVGLGKDGYERGVKRLPKDACAASAEQETKVLNKPSATKSNYVVNYWFLDHESDNDYLFLILDLCEETLQSYVDRESEDDLAANAPEIIYQVLKGLADLHYGLNPILHRDLKPSNILRNVHGKWLLADFGISRILTEGVRTHLSKQRGTQDWRAVESYPLEGKSDDDTVVRYKKESDIQVAGIVAYYIATKGQHPFGKEADRLRNLLEGKPIGLDSIADDALKDLLSWMLSHDPNDRPSAEEALKHPYLQPAEQNFEMLCKIGNEHEIKTQDVNSDVVRQFNSDSTDWKTLLRADVLRYLCIDFFSGRPRTFNYGSAWTECLRLIRNVDQHWKDRPRPRPQPEAFYVVGDPQEYFLKVFPRLPVVVHRIVRSCDWKERQDLQKYFM